MNFFCKAMKLNILLVFSFFLNSNIKCQIPNAGFEIWDSINGYEVPQNWNATLPDSIFQGAFKWSMSPHTGLYAMQLLAAEPGVRASCGFPISYHPITANGWYKAQRWSSYDTISILIRLYNNQLLVDTGYWLFTLSAELDWTPFTINLTTQSLFADSAFIYVRVDEYGPAASNISLWLDDLFFDDNSNIFSPASISDLKIIPNPVTNFISLKNLPHDISKSHLTILNCMGQQYKFFNLNSQSFSSLDISFLPPGIYELILQDESKIWVGKFVKQ